MGASMFVFSRKEGITRFSKEWSSGADYPAVSRGGDCPPFPRQRRRGRYSSPFTPFHVSSLDAPVRPGGLSGCLGSYQGGCPNCWAGWPGKAFPARASTDAGGSEDLPAAAPAGYAGPCHGVFSPSPPRPLGYASGGNLPRIRRPTPRFF